MTENKRPLEETVKFEDPMDMVNAVISTLNAPEERTNVANTYSNEKNVATEVQAYAKIAGCDWTYYVKTLLLTIGRNTDVAPQAPGHPPPQQTVDIDLGLAKVVSRQHAVITYNIDLRCWELKVLGRNGARMDGVKMAVGAQHAAPLHLGAILDIGGTQMMFILPDAPPSVLQKMLTECMSRYRPEKNKFPRIGASHGPSSSRPMPLYSQSAYQPNSSFQMFDKGQIAHSPSSVSAVSLQNNLDQDLSKEDSKDIKPPYSYATMITQAILSNSDGVMSLSEIYDWIASHYAYYKYSKTGWQNSIRHNLSLNKAFEKVPRRPNEPGKGMKWQISELYRAEFLQKIQNGTLLKSRRGLSVSRTLQIHLATHQNLPEQSPYIKSEPIASTPGQLDNMYQAPHPPSVPPMNSNKVSAPQNYARQQPVMMMQQGYMSQQAPQNMYLTPYSNPVYQQRMMIYGPNCGSNQVDQGPNQVVNTGSSGPPGTVQVTNSALNGAISASPNMIPQNGAHMQQNSILPHQHMEISTMPSRSNGDGVSKTVLKQEENGSMYLPPTNNQPSEGPNYDPGASYKGKTTQPPNFDVNVEENAAKTSFANTSNIPNTSESVQNSTAPTTSNTTELGLGFTSPTKVAPLEAFTPDRGSKAGAKNPHGTNQSSPAFWNFVQFSTPNGQTPGRKNSDESNVQVSPTLTRRTPAKIEEVPLNGSA